MSDWLRYENSRHPYPPCSHVPSVVVGFNTAGACESASTSFWRDNQPVEQNEASCCRAKSFSNLKTVNGLHITFCTFIGSIFFSIVYDFSRTLSWPNISSVFFARNRITLSNLFEDLCQSCNDCIAGSLLDLSSDDVIRIIRLTFNVSTWIIDVIQMECLLSFFLN